MLAALIQIVLRCTIAVAIMLEKIDTRIQSIATLPTIFIQPAKPSTAHLINLQ
jgi:hypothetical protein